MIAHCNYVHTQVGRMNAGKVLHSYDTDWVVGERIEAIRVVDNSIFGAFPNKGSIAHGCKSEMRIVKWRLNDHSCSYSFSEWASSLFTGRVLRVNNSSSVLAILGELFYNIFLVLISIDPLIVVFLTAFARVNA